jgi:hypothetical protein
MPVPRYPRHNITHVTWNERNTETTETITRELLECVHKLHRGKLKLHWNAPAVTVNEVFCAVNHHRTGWLIKRHYE